MQVKQNACFWRTGTPDADQGDIAMKKICAAMVGVVLIASVSSYAETKKKPPVNKAWTQEPASVFGLKLGEPMGASDIPGCRPYSPRESSIQKELCIEPGPGPYADRIATLNALPIDVAYSASIHLDDGLVSSLHIDISHDNYAKLRAILIERYGKPTKSNSSTVTSNGGVTLPAETLEWIGRNNSVYLFERFDRIDKSLAAFKNNELTRKSAERIIEKQKESASKM